MTEDEAKSWAEERFSTVVVEQLDTFAGWLREENERQNLVAPSTLDVVWSRHIVDSLQLLAFANAHGSWLDIGTGGGLPGLVIAIATGAPTILVEPRKRRAEFLHACSVRLGLAHTDVRATKVENVHAKVDVISARAVSSVENVLRASAHCATTATRWILPRGDIAAEEVDYLRAKTGMLFHVEQSLTNSRSSILVVTRS